MKFVSDRELMRYKDMPDAVVRPPCDSTRCKTRDDWVILATTDHKQIYAPYKAENCHLCGQYRGLALRLIK